MTPNTYGWINMCDAPIHDPMFCKKTSDVTYEGSPYLPELLKGEIVAVKRVTKVNIEEPE